ncbi:endonuclease/exonuclease/phosphatase family protein [Pseudomonas sp. PDM14]|uniref:endonuclease/exonuclease/phosphatase family protein n=1 Tax=Pseudomonas sp. PDM14 TaxID=2769288 RepID=UPI00177CAD58|nr:endonuclease/exonuclease/phosphatase family protein [Pseudomonas sp. PDM14]MBD9484295.1 endonuclease/exonuclease/phosphatase family protein [Pseudomonas sp. PDM14]
MFTLLRRILWLSLPPCLFGLLLPWLLRSFAHHQGALIWLLELAVHWQWLFLAGLLGGSALALLVQRRWLPVLLAAPLPWLSAAPSLPESEGAPQLRLASANLNLDNRDAGALRDWLALVQPDVVVLQELSPAFAQSLQPLPGYLYRSLSPQPSPFGIGVLSTMPLLDPRVITDDEGVQRIETGLLIPGCRVELTVLHPMPPISPRQRARRDRTLSELAQHKQKPSLLAGDLNTSPWAPAFVALQMQGWRRASGLMPTWGGPLGIPIDHVVASAHWQVVRQSRGPSLGSDHLPVLVDLRLQQDCPAAQP